MIAKKIKGFGYDVDADTTAGVDFFYPNRNAPQNTNLVIGLCDVRASGCIRVWYDFERDGFVIERQTVYSWNADDNECDPGWVECCLVSAPLPRENDL